jgi:type IV pilus assembly protein PilE
MNKPFLPSNRRSSVQSQQGFTLVELLITVVIVSILAAIAIPSYSSYILKSRRTDAKSALLDLASLEERYFSTNNTYTNLPVNLGYPATTPLPPLPFTVGSGYYNVTVAFTLAALPANATSAGTPATYAITAAAIGTQANDAACATFTISSSGQQTATGTDPNASVDCWK